MKRAARPIFGIAVAIVTLIGGIQFLSSLGREADGVARIVLFVPFVVLVTASFDFWNSDKPGCMTALSLLYAPPVAIAMGLFDLAAANQRLDPVLGWASAFRLPMMLAGLAGLGTIVLRGSKLIRGKAPWHGQALIKIMRTALILALLAGLFGLAWIGVGAGLRWMWS